MSGLSKARVAVAGGGALGSCIAFRLAQAGAQVTLLEPSDPQASASGVAAGMLAPAMECVLDPESGVGFDLLRRARDLWPALAAELGADIGLVRAGSAWLDVRGVAPRAASVAASLRAVGAAIAEPQVQLSGASEAVFTPEDWRLAPALALAALERGFIGLGGRRLALALESFEAGRARLSNGEALGVDLVVLATGAAPAVVAPELAALVPIKGQILKYPSLTHWRDLPALRCAGGYAVGGADGLCVGATMEVGVADRRLDPEAMARLAELAARLEPATRDLTPVGQAAVRAAFPHRPPLIGPSARPGVLLAAGARRNGWLLAPLAAEIIAAYAAGRDPGSWAAPFAARAPAVVL